MVEQFEKKPWVSFCMSTYKRPEFLQKQIKSLLQQTFTDFEIIISDNDFEADIKEFKNVFNDKRIQYHVNPTNLGMVKSFNKSLSLAKGEYVVMITDDDPVYPDMLQSLYELSNK
jgi:glycosyltransferase involved in cell wall biosynthesis